MHKKIDKSQIENIYELTELQKGIFYDCIKREDSSMYVIQNILEITGNINQECFLSAISSVFSTHTILRSVLRWENLSQPLCIIKKPLMPHVFWEIVNTQESLEKRTKDLSNVMLQKGIQLDDELIQFSVLQAKDKIILFVQFHHIIMDGWSFGILIKDLIAACQNRVTQGGNYFDVYKQLPVKDAKAMQFWQDVVQDYERTKLPICLAENNLNVTRKRIKFALDPETNALIKEFASNLNVPFAAVIYTVWSILLSQYTSQDRVTFGVVMSGRDSSIMDILTTVGLFSNILTWEGQVGSTSFEDAVMQAAELTYLLQDYQYTPLHEVQGLFSGMIESSLLETLVVIENYPLPPQCDEYTVRRIDTLENNSFPLILNVFSVDETVFEFDYNQALFNEDSINDFVKHFRNILISVVSAPDTQMNRISMLDNQEVTKILENFQHPQRPFLYEKSVVDLIEQVVLEMPDELALHHIDTASEMTYSQMMAMADGIAAKLLDAGVRKGDVICLLMDNALEFVPCMLGIMKCGCAFLPIESTYPAERIKLILDKVMPSVILTRLSDVEQINQAQYQVVTIESIELGVTVEKVPLEAKDTAYLIATSGTTGDPKCIEVSHQSFVDFVQWTIEEYRYSKKTKGLLPHSLAFDSALLQTFPPLASGGALYLLNPHRRTDSGYYLDILKKYRIEIIDEMATVLNLLFQKIEQEGMYKGKPLLPDMKCISLGSEHIPVDIARKCRKYLSSNGMIINAYGPAEATVVVSSYKFNGKDETEKSLIGKPRANAQMIILDKYKRLCPIGVPGEIHLSGICLAKGYYNDPIETHRKFIVHPFSDVEHPRKLYATGDRGVWLQDGNIEFLGRIDHQIKFHGYRLEVEGLEAQLQSALGGLNVAVLLVKELNNEYLIAFIETKEEISTTGLRRKLKKSIPAYFIPGQFIAVHSLPYNANGKVDRASLRNLVPKVRKKIPEEIIERPLQQELCDIWVEILGHADFGLDHNFYDVGGNSISVVKLLMKLKEIFPDCGFEIGDMFTYSTINQLTAVILDDKQIEEPLKKEDDTHPDSESDDIAIVGMSGRLPDADNLDEFWDNLLSAKECVKTIPEERKELDLSYFEGKTYLDWGYMDHIDKFDPLFFSIPPKMAEIMDPHHRIMLETAYLALENSGHFGLRNKSKKVGVFLSAIIPVYMKYLDNVSVDELLLTNLPSNMSGRIAYHLDLEGPALTLDTACSSSLVALHYAAESIRSGDCDSAIVGGCYIELEPIDRSYALHSGIVSEGGRCRSFSDQADGTIGGEGSLAVVLKRLSHALEDEDHIYAVLKGSAVVQDGNRSNGLASPSAEAQAECIQKAWQNANVSPRSVTYLEAHGSATKIGDPVEISGIKQAYQKAGLFANEQKVAIGSVKSNIGHLDAVSGLAGLVKSVLCLKHKKLVPSLYYDNPNPYIDFQSAPVYVETEVRAWEKSYPRRAGVSSFGVNGTNCHAILEEAPEKSKNLQMEKSYSICVVTAGTNKVLQQQLLRLSEYLKRNLDCNINDVAYTLGMGRQRLKYRKAFITDSVDHLCKSIDAFLQGEAANEQVSQTAPVDLIEIVKMFENGQEVDLKLQPGGRMISLPSNPFDSQSFWLSTVQKCRIENKEADLEKGLQAVVEKELLHEVIWQPITEDEPSEYKNFKTIMVFNPVNVNANVNEFVKMLSQLTEDIVIIEHANHFNGISPTQFEIDVTCEQHYTQLYQQVLEEFASIDMQFMIMPGNSSELFETTNDNDGIKSGLRFTMQQIQSMSKAVKSLTDPHVNCFITSKAIYVEGDDLLCDPSQSMVLSLQRTINNEIKSMNSKLIDIDSFETVDHERLDNIKKSLSLVDKELVVRKREIYSPVLETNEVNKFDTVQEMFRNNGVYLISGGLGGIALNIAAHIASKVKAKFILVSRSPISSHPEKLEKEKLIRHICNLGSQVEVIPLDISNRVQMNELATTIEQKYGRLNGILHAAGIVGQMKEFVACKWTDFDEMFQAKVYGTILLEKAMRLFAPEFTIMFSSIDAYLSNLTNSSYASANCFMQSFARMHRQLGKKMLTIDWGGWREIGMSDSANDINLSLSSFGQITAMKTGFSLADGLLAFDAITGLELTNAFVAYIDEQDAQMLRELGIRVNKESENSLQMVVVSDKNELVQGVADIWKVVLGLEAIDHNENFFVYGGDSIMAVAIIYELQKCYQISLSPDIILEYGTIVRLTDYLWEAMDQHNNIMVSAPISKAKPLS